MFPALSRSTFGPHNKLPRLNPEHHRVHKKRQKPAICLCIIRLCDSVATDAILQIWVFEVESNRGCHGYAGRNTPHSTRLHGLHAAWLSWLYQHLFQAAKHLTPLFAALRVSVGYLMSYCDSNDLF